MTRGLPTVELITPNCEPGCDPDADESEMSEPGDPNCAWLKRLKNSARKSSPTLSVRTNRLMREKSVFTKSGPESGLRFAVPNSPAAAGVKQPVLKNSLKLW